MGKARKQLNRNVLQVTSGKHLARGFTLIEIVVALAVSVILSGVGIYVAVGYLDQQKIMTTADVLTDLNAAVLTYKTKVGAYPFRLSHLTRPIATTDTTSCSGISPSLARVLYTTLQANTNWATGAPYFYQTISVQGFPLPIGTATDTLRRTVGNAVAGRLELTVPNVQYEDAVALNTLMDGSSDVNTSTNLNLTGAIRWSTSSTAGVRLTFGIPIGKTC